MISQIAEVNNMYIGNDDIKIDDFFVVIIATNNSDVIKSIGAQISLLFFFFEYLYINTI